MWPGIQEITHILQSEDELRYKQGQLAVVYARQPGQNALIPVAVGRMTANFNSDEMEWQSKGKCV